MISLKPFDYTARERELASKFETEFCELTEYLTTSKESGELITKVKQFVKTIKDIRYHESLRHMGSAFKGK